MPDRTGIFLGWSANLSNFLGLGVEAGASPMYPQKMRVPPLGFGHPQISSPPAWVELGPLAPDVSALTTELPRLHKQVTFCYILYSYSYILLILVT